MMTNSVCLPSAVLGFGLEVPSPNRVLNFSFKPESLLVGLAMVGRRATWDSVRGGNRQRSQQQLHTPAPADLQPPGNPSALAGTFPPTTTLSGPETLGNARPPARSCMGWGRGTGVKGGHRGS